MVHLKHLKMTVQLKFVSEHMVTDLPLTSQLSLDQVSLWREDGSGCDGVCVGGGKG